MIREERVKREKRVQILGASACAEAYNTGVSGNCLVLSALMRFLFLVFIKSFSLFKRYCPQGMPLHFPPDSGNVVASLVGARSIFISINLSMIVTQNSSSRLYILENHFPCYNI